MSFKRLVNVTSKFSDISKIDGYQIIFALCMWFYFEFDILYLEIDNKTSLIPRIDKQWCE